LPLTPRRLHALLAGAEPPRPAGTGKAELPTRAPADGRTMRGSGFVEVAAPPAVVWRALLDPESLKAVIPGCLELRKTGDNDYVADVSLGVGPVRGRFTATVGLSDLVTETSGRIGGSLTGPLGSASGSGMLRLLPAAAGTRIDYDYAVAIGGKVAAVGGRLLEGATQVIIRQFFERLGRRLAAPAASGGANGATKPRLWRRLFGRAEAP
jgi:2-furoyl-CoA dehydrogenase large subunit